MPGWNSKRRRQRDLKSTSLARAIVRCLKCPRCLRFPSSPRRSGDQRSLAIWLNVFPQPGGGWPLAFTLLQGPAKPRAQLRQTSRACGREVVSSDGPRCCTIRSYGRAAQQSTEAETSRVEEGAFADSIISRAVIDRFTTLGDQRRS